MQYKYNNMKARVGYSINIPIGFFRFFDAISKILCN